jgi:integration host factor subunit beta
LTKSELIEHVSEKLKLPNGKAEQIVNCVFDSMVNALQEGEGIEIRGFGSFTVRTYKSYEGRNPRTGETVHVEPKRLPFFKVGKDLRERVNAAAAAAAEAAASGRSSTGDSQRLGAPAPPLHSSLASSPRPAPVPGEQPRQFSGAPLPAHDGGSPNEDGDRGSSQPEGPSQPGSKSVSLSPSASREPEYSGVSLSAAIPREPGSS